jgi:hypothetical protein
VFLQITKFGRDVRSSHQGGFAYVDILLGLVLTAAIFTVALSVLVMQMDAYIFITGRKTGMADVRFAINRLSTELVALESVDLVSIRSDRIEFRDELGGLVSYEIVPYNGSLAVLRAGEVLLSPAESFVIRYFDQNSQELAGENWNIPLVRRVEVDMVQGQPGAGPILLTTAVALRGTFYTGYE